MYNFKRLSRRAIGKAPRVADVRVGNFVFHDEPDYIKVSDINEVVVHKVSKYIPKGQMLFLYMKEKREGELRAYAVVTFNVLCAVPDNEFLEKINAEATACAERHPEIYGVKKDISPEEDAEVLKEEKELSEVIEKAKEGAE